MNCGTRFARQVLLFGEAGQARIRATHVAICGVGGIGSHVVQQLALLGVERFTLIEPQELDESNKNRFVGHRYDDPIPGTPKIAIAERMIRAVSAGASIQSLAKPIEDDDAIARLRDADVVFGCLDHEGPRFRLNEMTARNSQPLIDAATEIHPGNPLRYGGRVFAAWERPGCLVCCGVLDMEEVQAEFESPEQRANRLKVYGLEAEEAGPSPSVVTLNGVIASIAATEFLVAVTGLRKPTRLTTYYAEQGRFTRSIDAPSSNCYTCSSADCGR